MTKKNEKSKEEKQIEKYRKVIEEYLSGKQYRPLTFQELVQKLSIIEDHIPLLKKVLEQLTDENRIIISQGRYQPFTLRNDVVQGVIRMNPRGFGFVEVEDINFAEDIFIPRPFTKNAVDGDIVEVAISPDSFSEKGPEGKVISILSRSRSHLAGIVTGLTHRYATVHVPLLGSDQPVLLELPTQEEIEQGDRIVMKVLEWGQKRRALAFNFRIK